MIIRKISFIVVIFALIGLYNCSEDNDNNTSRVQLMLVDNPGDYLEVNVEIIDILYNNSEDEDSWISFSPEGGYPIRTDLTELIAGNTLLLSNEVIPSGMLKQIRLVLSDNNTLVIEGEQPGETISKHLDTPSASQSGLKLKLDTELEPGYSYTFIFDWDVQNSIVKAGNSGKYILKPVIRVNTEVNSGSLSGTVTGEVKGDEIEGAVPLKDVPINVYSTDDIYIASSLTDENGNYLIQGLNTGDYRIKIEQSGYLDYESESAIIVTAGVNTDAGTIELLVDESL